MENWNLTYGKKIIDPFGGPKLRSLGRCVRRRPGLTFPGAFWERKSVILRLFQEWNSSLGLMEQAQGVGRAHRSEVYVLLNLATLLLMQNRRRGELKLYDYRVHVQLFNIG